MRRAEVGELAFGNIQGQNDNIIFTSLELLTAYRKSQGTWTGDDADIEAWTVSDDESLPLLVMEEIPEPVCWRIAGWADVLGFDRDVARKRFASREAAIAALDKALKGTRCELPHESIAELMQGIWATRKTDTDSYFSFRVYAEFAENTGL